MQFDFAPTQPGQIGELRQFLANAFGMTEQAPFLDEHVMQWKYFEPRPDWPRTRSYTLRRDGSIVAHGCAHPVTFSTSAGDVSSMRIVDWAGGADVPGAGVVLFRKFAALADTLLGMGGSEQTQVLLPKMGFRTVGSMSLYAKPVRPWLQFRSRPDHGWRAAARLVRSAAWARRPLAPIRDRSVAVTRVRSLDSVPLPKARLSATVARRSAELLSYMLVCPGAVMSAHCVGREGYFVLSRVRGQARIADLWVDSDDAQAWTSAYSLAARAASEDPATAEVMAVASTAVERRALEENGFSARGSEPMFLYDPKGRLAGAPPLRLQLLDGDEFYLDNPDYPFLT